MEILKMVLWAVGIWILVGWLCWLAVQDATRR